MRRISLSSVNRHVDHRTDSQPLAIRKENPEATRTDADILEEQGNLNTMPVHGRNLRGVRLVDDS